MEFAVLHWTGLPLSYLSEREQRLRVGEHYSDSRTIGFGVPQGSVLGPTLFLLYINDLCSINLSNAKLFTFADDTAIVFRGKSWEEAYSAAQTGIDRVNVWLAHNLLTLNADKTKVIEFCVSRRTAPHSLFAIRLHTCENDLLCNCPSFQRVHSIKYLGVFLDSSLSWAMQIDSISSRTRKLLHIFRRLRDIATEAIIKTIYFSLAQSIFNYCITTWGSGCKSRLLKVERAQRALLKVSYKKPRQYRTDALYNETKVLSIRRLFILATALRFHKAALLTLPQLHRPQRCLKWTLPTIKLKFGKRCFNYMGPYIYTKLHNLIDIVNSTRFICKNKICTWLLGLNYESTESFIPK
ncbi:hypothetical protein JYU34_014199 [Plutella xylostella]|uniref:Reverse transcriptase domain-containing protein n=1 Tax=Plutella xylostella TaxID=51655 RepID=A0ABQ7Q988_PLUXY|nr:hypothetical protein JYU34_014199 [Plutella xylostella]